MNFQVHNRTIKKNEKKEKKKNVTLGWKSEKGSLEQKRENFQRLTGKATKKRRRMKGQRPDSIWSLHEVLYPFRNRKIWTFYSRMTSPEFSNLSRLVLTPVKLPYSETRKNESFQDAWFPKNSFFQKGLENVPSFLLNQFVKVNLLSQIIGFQVNTPFGDFLTVITNFFLEP